MYQGLVWPPEQLFLGAEELEQRAKRCRGAVIRACADMRIESDLSALVPTLYLPFAAWLLRRRNRQRLPLVVGVCGGQGSGKSTVCRLLVETIEHGYGRRAASLSIDDIYKTHEDRQRMARQVHPLFATRGVPGTHDVGLGIEALRGLRCLRDGECMSLPSFDKACDTRRARAQWPRVAGPLDIILFEGWCVGAVAQSEQELREPVNALERDEDPGGRWRGYVNRALQGEYRELFRLLDVLVLLQVGGMARVFQWRQLQERKLAERSAEAGADERGMRIMSEPEVERFVMHYERVTRHILEEMPRRADIVFPVDHTHNPARVIINAPVP